MHVLNPRHGTSQLLADLNYDIESRKFVVFAAGWTHIFHGPRLVRTTIQVSYERKPRRREGCTDLLTGDIAAGGAERPSGK